MPPLPDPASTGDQSHGEITRLLRAASSGNRDAFDGLVPLVYEELRRIAATRLRSEPTGHTLSATALVHEAYLRLVPQERAEWQSRAQFFAVAALAMRRILINHARTRERDKRGAGAAHVGLDAAEHMGAGAVGFAEEQSDDLIALDEALTRLRAFNPEGADVIEYRFFGGLQFKEIAEVLGVSEVTVRRRWTAARAWLGREVRA